MSNSESGKEEGVSSLSKTSDNMTNGCHFIPPNDGAHLSSQATNASEIQSNCVGTAGNSFNNENYLEGETYSDKTKEREATSFSNAATNNSAVGSGGHLSSSPNLANTTEGFSTDGIDGMGISNDESDKHFTLRFSIPIPQAGPRPTSSIHGSAYSTPGTFSISSRGCTSTAPSTAPSTCSLNSVSSSNDKGAVGNVGFASGPKGKTQNQPGNMNNTVVAASKQTATIQYISENSSNVGLSTVSGSSPTNTSSTNTGNNASNNNNVDRIDSALLSALYDPREKYGLLRLERTLIDFMNERTTGYIEVGGPNNSIVIGGQSGGRLASGLTNGAAQGQISTSNNIENEGRSGKQTSFQRLCLHRLADRFNIVRESASSASSWSTGISPSPSNGAVDDSRSSVTGIPLGSGPSVPGLIRLVKVKNSRIPQNLLIDLDVSSYQCTNSTDGSPHYAEASFGVEKGSENMKDLSDSLAATTLDNKSSVTFVKKQISQPRRKMMIMKRNNNSNGSLKSENSNDQKKTNKKNRNNLKGKNLSDKEKAYAEARARIFNESISTSENGETNEKADGNGAESNPSGARQAISASPSSSVAPSEVEEDSDQVSRAANTQSYGLYESTEVEIENSSTSTSRSFVRDTQNSQAVASATSGATSKVTWRNRRQEENDPDFWRGGNRGAGIYPQYPYGSAASSQTFVNGASPNVQSNGYSHHNMMPQHQYNPQVFYPSGSHSRLSYNTNTTSSGGHYSHGMSHSHSQQASNYYGNHNQANAYYSQQQQSQHHQMRQNYHHLNSGTGSSFVSASSNTHVGLYANAESSTGSSNNATGRRTGQILYNMEEFPALR